SQKNSSSTDVSLLTKNGKKMQDRVKKGSYKEETKIVYGKKVLVETKNIIERTETGLSICSSLGGLELTNSNRQIFDCFVNLVSRCKEDKVNDGVRWIINIDNNDETIRLAKKF